MSFPAPTPPLQAWVGCLSCYNNGHLVGVWIDAIDADTVTVADLHKGREKRPYMAFCEELWCLDHELPQRGEMSPARATAWGERLAEIDEVQLPAFLAWIRTGAHVVDADDLPIASDFEERYCGEYTSFDDFAREQIDALGVLAGVDDEIARYFDAAAYARDLAHSYTVVDAESGVYIFRDL
ncbi:antirestriction protein ArdA [Corynebacterium xerosis]|uniref:antirestriction protein ArdA n=1 Tax=Corynebacterium xerosis TaxID=1725 RepID=UPI000EB1C030|nr:antirestriction protein ArdA [Corynebacterium xerosis]AYJ33028.1 antirestriction protein ArdA [Corynebacterium xerosis]